MAAKRKTGEMKDKEFKQPKNEMRPGWECTLMAEDIFKTACALYIKEHPGNMIGNHDSHWERIANASMNASLVFRRVQKERKFPETLVQGNIAEND